MSTTDAADLLAAVDDLAPRIRAAALEGDAARRLPLSVIQGMHCAGLFRMCLPRDLGGSQQDPLTVFRIIEAVTRLDGSTGWLVLVHAGTPGLIIPFLRDDVAREIFLGDPDAIIGGTVAPRGQAVVVAGGYQVSGRWAFASGCEHCAWLVAGCVVYDGDQPRHCPDGTPVTRLVLLPADACQIHDTWDGIGLRGTGSHDISVTELFVPEERSLSPVGDASRRPEAHVAILLLNVMHAAHALGVARHALDAFTAFAHASPIGRPAAREHPLVQVRMAQAEALVGAARAYVLSSTEDAWQTACAGEALNKHQRIRLRLATTHAVQSAAQAVDLVYDAGGGWAVYHCNQVERCFRDIHTATQHVVVATPSYVSVGRSLLDIGLSETTADSRPS